MGSQINKVVYATGSRADYGIVRRFLCMLQTNNDIELSVVVTGALLDARYGSQVGLVERDGFRISSRVELPLDTSSNVGVIHSMSVALDGFSDFFFEERPDLLIILGDRYEMLSVAIAAAMQAIPILHIHGGEATYGNYDEFIRHSITKMSRFHFTSTEEYRHRVIQLGEDPKTVFNLGALGAENCLRFDIKRVPDDLRRLPDRGYAVVLFHPETLSGEDPGKQVDELLEACDRQQGLEYIFIGSNADTLAEVIRAKVKRYVASHRNSRYFENLIPDAYHYLVSRSAFLIGNSSSGLIEAPSLGTVTINVGNRQAGRVRGCSVIDVPCSADKIAEAMSCASTQDRPLSSDNPYYVPCCAERYVETTLQILSTLRQGGLPPKRFYDVDFKC